jgi:hypothetical protein
MRIHTCVSIHIFMHVNVCFYSSVFEFVIQMPIIRACENEQSTKYRQLKFPSVQHNMRSRAAVAQAVQGLTTG